MAEKARETARHGEAGPPPAGRPDDLFVLVHRTIDAHPYDWNDYYAGRFPPNANPQQYPAWLNITVAVLVILIGVVAVYLQWVYDFPLR